MKKSEFRTPLIQSAMLLGGAIILFTSVSSSGATSAGGSILALLSTIGHIILFIIGLTIGVSFCIAVLVGLFLAAVAMVSPEQSTQMYSDLKKNLSQGILTFKESWTCCEGSGQSTGITEEEYNLMKQEVALLDEKNRQLQGDLKILSDDNKSLVGGLEGLKGDNNSLYEKIEEISQAVGTLQNSEQSIRDIITDLTSKIPAGPDQAMLDQISQLETLQKSTRSELENLIERLGGVENSTKDSTTSGIFSYIESDEDQALFIKKVEEALADKLTYAQIDEYLTSNLPKELDLVIKDHPSLTKNYIRNLRQD